MDIYCEIEQNTDSFTDAPTLNVIFSIISNIF